MPHDITNIQLPQHCQPVKRCRNSAEVIEAQSEVGETWKCAPRLVDVADPVPLQVQDPQLLESCRQLRQQCDNILGKVYAAQGF